MSSIDIYTNKNRFCVYAHFRNDTNKMFYIGSGTIERSRHTSGRSKAWNDIVNVSNGFYTEILHNNLDKTSSLKLETKNIIENYDDIVNTKIYGKQKDIDFETVSKLFVYDETSPSGIIWAGDRFSGHNYKRLSARKGDPAGYIYNNKIKHKTFWMTRCNKKVLFVHRIIWVLFNKTIPENMVIDHIDNTPLNNKIENLRCVDQVINTRNRNISPSNITGKVGVRFRSMYAGKYNYFIAQYHVDGKMYNKIFSIDKLDHDEALKQACEWRTNAMNKLNDSGAGYTENHF